MSLLGLYTFVFPGAGECSVPGGGSPFDEANGARGVFLWVPARAPRVLPLSFPKFAHKREAMTCGVRSRTA